MTSFEQKYYEYESFWNAESGLLDDDNRARYAELTRLVPSDARSVVDVGCGNGLFCAALSAARPSLRVVGMDRSKAALAHVAVEKYEGDITAIPFADKAFDCVTCFEVIEHLPVPTYQRGLRELARVSARYLVVSVPNRQDLVAEMTRCTSCGSMFHPDLHMRSFDDEALRSLFVDAGFTCIDIAHLNAFRVYRGLEKVLAWRRKRAAQKNGTAHLMTSPLCPICGFENEDHGRRQAAARAQAGISSPSRTSLGATPFALAKEALKLVWPKDNRARWLAAVYERRT